MVSLSLCLYPGSQENFINGHLLSVQEMVFVCKETSAAESGLEIGWVDILRNDLWAIARVANVTGLMTWQQENAFPFLNLLPKQSLSGEGRGIFSKDLRRNGMCCSILLV